MLRISLTLCFSTKVGFFKTFCLLSFYVFSGTKNLVPGIVSIVSLLPFATRATGFFSSRVSVLKYSYCVNKFSFLTLFLFKTSSDLPKIIRNFIVKIHTVINRGIIAIYPVYTSTNISPLH